MMMLIRVYWRCNNSLLVHSHHQCNVILYKSQLKVLYTQIDQASSHSLHSVGP